MLCVCKLNNWISSILLGQLYWNVHTSVSEANLQNLASNFHKCLTHCEQLTSACSIQPSGTLIAGPELNYLLFVATFNMDIYYCHVFLLNRSTSTIFARLNRCSDQYRVSAHWTHTHTHTHTRTHHTHTYTHMLASPQLWLQDCCAQDMYAALLQP